MIIDKEAVARFWEKVEKDDGGCWRWLGAKNISGGYAYDGERVVRAIRYSYFMKNGEIPSGKRIYQKCNNLDCVNPDHLGIILAGRKNKKSTKLRSCIISDSVISSIREKYKPWLITQQHLAKEFGISQSHISRIIHSLRRPEIKAS